MIMQFMTTPPAHERKAYALRGSFWRQCCISQRWEKFVDGKTEPDHFPSPRVTVGFE